MSAIRTFAAMHGNLWRVSAVFFLLLTILAGCGQQKQPPGKLVETASDLYDTYDSATHLQPAINKIAFDTLHSWELGGALLEPIDIATDGKSEIDNAKRLSPAQKALYFFWYLDDEVTSGGFIQFYWDGDRKYLAPLRAGLAFLNDTAMLHLVDQADQAFMANVAAFRKQKQTGDVETLYKDLPQFDNYDSLFYKYHDHTMVLIEQYARQHPGDFVRLK